MKRLMLVILLVQPLAIWSGTPITLHPQNPHYFLYHGKPTVLITSGEHYGAVLNKAFDFDIYLKTLSKDGLNLTRLFTGTYVEKPGAFGIKYNSLAPAENQFIPPWVRSDRAGYTNGGNKFDLDHWNPDYFERLKNFIQTANEHDVIVEVVLFSSIYTNSNWEYNPFNPANNINNTPEIDFRLMHTTENGEYIKYQEKVVRKIVRELNDFDNIYYEIQNEPWADQSDSALTVLDNLKPNDMRHRGTFWKNRIDLPTQIAMDWQQKIAAIIVLEEEKQPKKHVIAHNYCNFFYPIKEVNPDISILNFHYALPIAVQLNYGYNKPISFDESGFSGSLPGNYRRQAWRFLMSGGAVFSGLDYPK